MFEQRSTIDQVTMSEVSQNGHIDFHCENFIFLKVEYLKKSHIWKMEAIPSQSEHFKIGMESLGVELWKELGPNVENNK